MLNASTVNIHLILMNHFMWQRSLKLEIGHFAKHVQISLIKVKQFDMGLYKDNKEAKVHSKIECPICHKVFEKIQYSQAFCSGHCKDKFWNNKGDRHVASQSKK